MIHLDHLATTPLAPVARTAMLAVMDASVIPLARTRAHAAGRYGEDLLWQANGTIGALVGAPAEAVTLTSGATEANHLAIRGIAAMAPPGRDTIVISALEHPCVHNAAVMAASTHGLSVRIAPVGTDGQIDLAALGALMDERVALVSVQAANHEIGTIQPITAVAAAAKVVGALFHCDASQAPGLVPLALADGIDLVTLSAHKIHGPQGIGALVVQPSPPIALAPLLPDGDPSRLLRAGTPPLMLAAGFAAAASAVSTRDPAQLAARRNQLATGLAGIAPAFTPTTASSPRLPHVLHGKLPGIDTALLAHTVGTQVIIGTGAACAASTREPSPLLKGLGWTAMDRASSLRLSVGADTTAGDIDRALKIIANTLQDCTL